MNAFNAVQNTYLSTFQLLGGLGLILGSFGLGAVVLRNLQDRRKEWAILAAVGFSSRRLRGLVCLEHLALLVIGLLMGAGSAVLATWPSLGKAGEGVAWLPFVYAHAWDVSCRFILTWAAASRLMVRQVAPLLQGPWVIFEPAQKAFHVVSKGAHYFHVPFSFASFTAESPDFAMLLNLRVVFLFTLRMLTAGMMSAQAVVFDQRFDETVAGQTPEDFLVLGGRFKVQDQMLMLPGAPLDNHELSSDRITKGISKSGQGFVLRRRGDSILPLESVFTVLEVIP